MFTDKVELKDFEKMDPEYQELLKRVLEIQCDCEIGGPHLYIEDMLPNAPSKLDRLVVARTAAEEMDHYRKMARLAGDIGEDVSHVLSSPNQKRYVEAFRGKITTWDDPEIAEENPDADLPSDMLDGVSIATFGMGDSHYVHFNSVAKSMHERMLELGAPI